MPLVMFVLVVIVLIVNANDSSKMAAKQKAFHDEADRKTNAQLEAMLVRRYGQLGKSFQDSYIAARQDLIEAGFVPCIPRTFWNEHLDLWKDNRAGYEKRVRYAVDQFNSTSIKNARDTFTRGWERAYGRPPSEKELWEMLYEETPKGVSWQVSMNAREDIWLVIKPIGSYVLVSGKGTCEILAYDFGPEKHLSSIAFYEMIRLDNGELFKILIDSKDISSPREWN